MTSNNESLAPISPAEPSRVFSPDQELGPNTCPVTQRFRAVMARFTELCRGDLEALVSFTNENPAFIQINTDDYAAWRVAVECLNEAVCKYLWKTFWHELFEQPKRSLVTACLTGDLKAVKMMLDRDFGLNDNHVLISLQIAGENRNKELIDLILAERHSGFGIKYQPIVAAICGVLRSGKPQLLEHLIPQLVVGCDQATTEKLYRGILVRAAQIKDPNTFIEVLKRVDCGFKYEPNSDHGYFGFTQTFGATHQSDTLLKIFGICCENPSNVLIDAVIDAFGGPMLIDNRYRPCLKNACANGHTCAVKFLTDKHDFSSPKDFIKVARAHNQASVIALFYYKYGEKFLFGADPEHENHIRQLLSEQFAKLSHQFSANSTPGNP